MSLRPDFSLTARLALLFAVLTASLLIVVGIVLGRAVEAHFLELDEHELAGKLSLIGHLLQRSTTADAFAALPARLDDAFVGHDAVAVLIRDHEGSVIYALQPRHFDDAQLGGQPLAAAAMWRQGERHFIGREAVFAVPAGAADGENTTLTVLLGLDISHHAHFLEAVRNRLWLGISVAAVAAALLGWLAAHKGLAPLRRVAATAQQLSVERLGERLAESDAPSEVREVVEALNGMFERLEASFRRLTDFSADIAHELRTPVSNLMTQTEVALSRARTPEEYRDVLASNLEEYERIARMVSDMLFLAQTENGRLPGAVETVSLATEAGALIDFYEALAEERGVGIVLSGDATVSGDRLMLRRALANLLSNAIRHSAHGTTIAIEIARAGGNARLTVRNPGETIAPEQLARIFERFHRASPERHRHGEGAGLGLAITRSIAAAHGGRVSVTSADGNTAFTIELPLADGGLPSGN